MKQIIACLIFVFAYGFSYGQQDAIDKYFSKYKDNEDFSVVYISPKMFSLISKLDDDDMDDDLREAIQGVHSLKILTTDRNGAEFYKEAKSLINTKEYEVLMTVRDDESDIEFLVKDSADGNIVDELLLLVGGEDSFVLLSFYGKIHLNKLSKLAESIEIDGMEHLDKLEDKN